MSDEPREDTQPDEDVEGHKFNPVGDPVGDPVGQRDEDDDVEGHAIAADPLNDPLNAIAADPLNDPLN